MKQNKYFGTSIGLYMNYFVHGIQAIVIAQNMDLFARMWGTDSAGVMGVIAATGVGKFIVLIFSGSLSDKLGRKPLVFTGMIGYILFFGGLIVNTNLTMAYIIAFIAGAATSFLDAATYPALMEIYPNNPSSASVAVKGFISISGMLLPIFIGWANKNGLWYGWPMVIPLAIVVINIIFMLNARFPDQDMRNLKAKEPVKKHNNDVETRFVQKPSYRVEGLILILYSFCCMATFYLFQQVITLYGEKVIGMSEIASRALLSYYTVGSFIAVLLSSLIMAAGIRNIAIMVIYGFISALTLLVIYLFPAAAVITAGAFIIGFTVAGGVLQTGNAILSEFFPIGKGKNTGMYNISMSIATYVMPTIASRLIETDFTKVMLLDAATAVFGFVLMVLLSVRYRKVFGVRNIFSKVVKVKSE